MMQKVQNRLGKRRLVLWTTLNITGSRPLLMHHQHQKWISFFQPGTTRMLPRHWSTRVSLCSMFFLVGGHVRFPDRLKQRPLAPGQRPLESPRSEGLRHEPSKLPWNPHMLALPDEPVSAASADAGTQPRRGSRVRKATSRCDGRAEDCGGVVVILLSWMDLGSTVQGLKRLL